VTQEQGKDYGALRMEFAEWTMNPFGGTQRDWAEAHGLSEATLSRWKAEPDFVDLIKDWRQRGKVAIPAMLKRVIRRVLETGDPHAYRAVMESLGESKLEVDVNVTAPFLELQKKLVEIRRQSLDTIEASTQDVRPN
jgi:RNA processing factor Prp31